jgi:hypothetical protein
MNALTEFLFPAPARRSTGGIIRWWESRRLAYNLMVGAAGVVSLGVVDVISWLPPRLPIHPLVPWQGIVAFGVMANVCYLLGPLVEVTADKLWGRQLLPVGPALFRMGLTFSVGLALFPILLMMISWVVRAVIAVF